MVMMGKHVFYIQSETVNSMLIRLILHRYGVRLTCDRWAGDETLARLAAHTPIDLILLDLTASNEAQGYEICEIIHKDPQFQLAPVVAVAQLNPVIGMAKARAKGFFGYLGTPINATLFPQHIAKLLQGIPVWHSF